MSYQALSATRFLCPFLGFSSPPPSCFIFFSRRWVFGNLLYFMFSYFSFAFFLGFRRHLRFSAFAFYIICRLSLFPFFVSASPFLTTLFLRRRHCCALPLFSVSFVRFLGFFAALNSPPPVPGSLTLHAFPPPPSLIFSQFSLPCLLLCFHFSNSLLSASYILCFSPAARLPLFFFGSPHLNLLFSASNFVYLCLPLSVSMLPPPPPSPSTSLLPPPLSISSSVPPLAFLIFCLYAPFLIISFLLRTIYFPSSFTFLEFQCLNLVSCIEAKNLIGAGFWRRRVLCGLGFSREKGKGPSACFRGRLG